MHLVTPELNTYPVPFNNLTIGNHRETHQLDLVIPCCNPPEGWAAQMIADYWELQDMMPETGIQLILVNDGSVRNVTHAHFRQLEEGIPGVRIINHPVNRGKGYAVRLGVAVATGDYQVCTDFDFPFGVKAVKQAFEQLLHGSDVVAGIRGEQYVKLLPRKRKVITTVNRFMNRYLLHLPVADAQAGLKGFNSKGRREFLATRINGFLYDSEFVHRAGKNKSLKIRTIPIVCRPGICFSEFRSKVLLREFLNFIAILTVS